MVVDTKIIPIRYTTLLDDIMNMYKLPTPLWQQCYYKHRGMYKVKLVIIPRIGTEKLRLASKGYCKLDSAMQCVAHAAIRKLKAVYGFEIADYNLAVAMRDRDRRRIAEGIAIAHKAEYISLKEQVKSLNMVPRTPSEEENLKQRKKRRLADVNAMYWKLECKSVKDALVRCKMENMKLKQLLKMQ